MSRLTGEAGEHYAAMRLNLAGVETASLAARHPVTDLIALRDGAAVTVQVKTRGRNVGRGESIDMKPAKIGLNDFLVVVLLGGDDSRSEPVGYVLPRAAAVEWVGLFNDNNERRACTRMNVASREYLRPFREAWQQVSERLEAPG